MLIRDEQGLWVVDFKTAGKFGSLHFLDFDEQVSAYMWGVWRQFGEMPKGVMYWEFLKSAPAGPKRNKNGRLSGGS